MADFTKLNIRGEELDIRALILNFIFSGADNQIVVCDGNDNPKLSSFYARYATKSLSGFVVIGDNIDVDTNGKISLSIANDEKLGLVMSQTTGIVEGRDYVIQVDSEGKMKTNVPWKNYSAGTHITITDDTTGVAPTIKTDIPAYPTDSDKGSKFLAGDGTWKSMGTVAYAEKAKYLVAGPTSATTSATVHASDSGDLYAHTLTLT